MGLRVLVVEDDVNVRDMLKVAAESWGYETATAVDGQDGLAQVKAFKPQLIILDLVMPNLNGLEMIQEMRRTYMAPVPIVVMTGFADRFNEKILREDSWIVDCLFKPLDLPALAERLKNTLAEPAPKA